MPVDFLNPEDQAEGIAGAIKELVRRKVDVIVPHFGHRWSSTLTPPLKNGRPSQARSTSCWPEADLFAVQGCCGRTAGSPLFGCYKPEAIWERRFSVRE